MRRTAFGVGAGCFRRPEGSDRNQQLGAARALAGDVDRHLDWPDGARGIAVDGAFVVDQQEVDIAPCHQRGDIS